MCTFVSVCDVLVCAVFYIVTFLLIPVEPALSCSAALASVPPCADALTHGAVHKVVP